MTLNHVSQLHIYMSFTYLQGFSLNLFPGQQINTPIQFGVVCKLPEGALNDLI